MNSTLEQIAQTLFKHWFIDFEFPDENGNPYRSSGCRMVDSELGEIPEGWEVGSILDYADLLSGGTPKTSVSEFWDGGVPWVSAKDVTSSNGTFILTAEKTITQKGIDKSNAKLLPKYTTVITARGTVGNVCILSTEMAINQTNYGLKCKYDYGDFFLFFAILGLIQDMKQNAYGTVFDTITTKTFRQIQITLPPIKLIESFENIVGNIMHEVLFNLEESQNLSSIRDSLLPKLMSGKIRV
jgi:type I restriction enzyme, S subunit